MSSRPWNRREFTVTINGGFAILKPNGWFAAVHLPKMIRSLTGQSEVPSSQQAHENPTAAVPHEWEALSGQMAPGVANSEKSAIECFIARIRALARPAMIALVATAMMWSVVWWLVWYGSPSIAGYRGF
jgi:hypothetical protein